MKTEFQNRLHTLPASVLSLERLDRQLTINFNQVRDVITSFFTSTLSPLWKMFEETRMVKTGLVLRPASLTEIDQLGRRQPDWIVISEEYRNIAIVDLCRPSDVNNAQLLAAAMRKQ